MDLDEVRKEIDKLKGKLVIVEGKKDKSSLEKLGFKKILMLEGKPLYEVIENIKEKEAAILTDLDTKGRELYSKLKRVLPRRGIKVNDKLRKMLFRTKLRHIEGLANYLERNS